MFLIDQKTIEDLIVLGIFFFSFIGMFSVMFWMDARQERRDNKHQR